VGPVAEGFIVTEFAATKKYFTSLFGGVFYREEGGVRMGSITKRLLTTFAAGTPKIGFSLYNIHAEGCTLGNNRFRHGKFSQGSKYPMGCG